MHLQSSAQATYSFCSSYKFLLLTLQIPSAQATNSFCSSYKFLLLKLQTPSAQATNSFFCNVVVAVV
jgi:hypothetical protein